MAITLVTSVSLALPALGQEEPVDPCLEEPTEWVGPLPLCGTTTLTGDEAGVIPVRIPEPVRIENEFDGPDPDIEVEGTGEFVGFLLMLDDPDRRGETPMLLGGRVRTAPGFFWSGDVFQAANTAGGNALELEPGDYLLYLLADGSDVRVTLRLEELYGGISLTPEQQVYFESGPPVAGVDTGGNLYAGGVTGDLPHTGMAFQALWTGPFITGPVATDTTCRYRGEPPGPDAYLPPCDGAVTGGSVGVVVPGGFALRALAPRLTAGVWSYGGSFSMVGVPSDYGQVVFFLSFD